MYYMNYAAYTLTKSNPPARGQRITHHASRITL